MFVEGEEIKVIVPATGQMIYRTRTQHARMQQVGAISTPQQLGSFETSSVYRWRQLEAN
jgi:hypothetical protein